MRFLAIAIFLFSSFADAAFVLLKDGTKIEGQAEGEMDDFYMIRTKYGVLTVKKDEVLNPQDLESVKEDETQAKEEFNASKSSETAETAALFSMEVTASSGGVAKIFYENSVAIATATYNLKNELLSIEGEIKNGKYSRLYPSGKILSEIYFENGRENGPAKFYYENGNLQTKAEYKNGLLEGTVYSYSPEGILLAEQNYKDGLLDGAFIEYLPDGTLKNKVLYSKGAVLMPKTEDKAAMPEDKTEPLITVKKKKVARGFQFLVYSGKKYKGSFTVSENGVELENRREGIMPDGTLKVYSDDGSLTDEFIFENNRIVKYSRFNKDRTEVFDFKDDKGK